ncbi:unnamed protein product [Calypogeia fissa]
MRLLGIEEWVSVYLLAQRSGVQMALLRIKEYAAILDCMEGDDAFELEKANAAIRTMALVLNQVAKDTDIAYNDIPGTPTKEVAATPISGIASSSSEFSSPLMIHISDRVSTSASPAPVFEDFRSVFSEVSPISFIAETPIPPSLDLGSNIKENPLLDLDWLTEDELIEMNIALSCVDSTPIPTQNDPTEAVGPGEPFVPLLPSGFLEYESSKEDGCMWRIKNINNLAPISLDMWQAWATVSTDEVLRCRERALQEVTLCDKPPVFVSQWPMTVFGAPKYKCLIAAGAKIRGKLDSKNSRIKDHKSKIGFLIEAANEFVANPEAKLLAQYGEAKGIRMIEALIKPGMFSEAKAANAKKRFNLIPRPESLPKCKSMYANPAPAMGRGRGGLGGPAPGLIQGGNTGNSGARNRLGHGKALPGNVSPLLQRNIPF